MILDASIFLTENNIDNLKRICYILTKLILTFCWWRKKFLYRLTQFMFQFKKALNDITWKFCVVIYTPLFLVLTLKYRTKINWRILCHYSYFFIYSLFSLWTQLGLSDVWKHDFEHEKKGLALGSRINLLKRKVSHREYFRKRCCEHCILYTRYQVIIYNVHVPVNNI